MIRHRIQARLSKLSKYFCNINIFRTKWLIARSHEYIFLHQLIFYPGTVPLFAYQHSDTIRADRSGGVLLSTSLPALPAPKIALRSSGIITGTCHINHARNDASIGVRVPSPPRSLELSRLCRLDRGFRSSKGNLWDILRFWLN